MAWPPDLASLWTNLLAGAAIVVSVIALARDHFRHRNDGPTIVVTSIWFSTKSPSDNRTFFMAQITNAGRSGISVKSLRWQALDANNKWESFGFDPVDGPDFPHVLGGLDNAEWQMSMSFDFLAQQAYAGKPGRAVATVVRTLSARQVRNGASPLQEVSSVSRPMPHPSDFKTSEPS